jgi:hypothetical protein
MIGFVDGDRGVGEHHGFLEPRESLRLLVTLRRQALDEIRHRLPGVPQLVVARNLVSLRRVIREDLLDIEFHDLS